jgi:hypothetical protein
MGRRGRDDREPIERGIFKEGKNPSNLFTLKFSLANIWYKSIIEDLINYKVRSLNTKSNQVRFRDT